MHKIITLLSTEDMTRHLYLLKIKGHYNLLKIAKLCYLLKIAIKYLAQNDIDWFGKIPTLIQS